MSKKAFRFYDLNPIAHWIEASDHRPVVAVVRLERTR